MTRSTSSASRRGRRRMSRVAIALVMLAAVGRLEGLRDRSVVGSPEGLRYSEGIRYAAVAQPFRAAYQLPTELPSTKFKSGQDVVPYFEGWIHNKDGSFDLVFGYFNRNWEEELAIPAGADNIVEPGGPDRAQPTYFLARRQGWVYRVRVPSDFGKGVVTWTIRANGKTA